MGIYFRCVTNLFTHIDDRNFLSEKSYCDKNGNAKFHCCHDNSAFLDTTNYPK